MDFDDFKKVLENALGLLGMDGQQDKAVILVSKAVSLIQVADIALKGIKEIRDIAGLEDMTQAELQERFLKNDGVIEEIMAKVKEQA
jgi:hypothetical protein